MIVLPDERFVIVSASAYTNKLRIDILLFKYKFGSFIMINSTNR